MEDKLESLLKNNPPAQQHTKVIMSPWLYLPIVVLLFLFLGLIIFIIKHGVTYERPTDREDFYHRVAFDYNHPELCELISSKAQHRVGFGNPGYQSYYAQSECFYNVALKYSDLRLCDHIRKLSIPILMDGSEISKKGCLQKVNDKSSESILWPGFPDYIAQYMIDLGYKTERCSGGFQHICYEIIYENILSGTEAERNEFMQRIFDYIKKK